MTLFHTLAPLLVDFDGDFSREALLYYAKKVISRYGDGMPYWLTLNEPNIGMPYLFSTCSGFTHVLLAYAGVCC